jgi:Ni/Fe-hydrogenase subunit HybB-like protein
MKANNLKSFISFKTSILFVLSIIGIITIIHRLMVGLGKTTNLSDNTPWGLWISFDVIAGVALAAGGFAIGFAAYVMGWEKYRPIARSATLTAFLGYLIAVIGVCLDIGKPFSIWHPLIFWQPHSMMFEIAICFSLYTFVLFLDFLPWLLEALNKFSKLKIFLEQRAVVLTLAVLGIMISFGHQSSLGGLFMLTPESLHPLWYSNIIHHLFYLSAICGGISMVSCETVLSSKIAGHPIDIKILKGLAKGSTIALLIYLLVKISDLAINNEIPYIFSGTHASILFIIEMSIGVIIPLIFLSNDYIRSSIPALFTFHCMVVFGVLFDRFNVVFLSQMNMYKGNIYFPSLQELTITIGLVSIALILFKACIMYLPIIESKN